MEGKYRGGIRLIFLFLPVGLSDFHLQSGGVNQLKTGGFAPALQGLGMCAHVSNPVGIKDLKEERAHE